MIPARLSLRPVVLFGLSCAFCAANPLAYQITTGSTISVLNTATLQETGAIGVPGPAQFLSLSPDGTKLFSSAPSDTAGQGSIGVFEVNTTSKMLTGSWKGNSYGFAGPTAVSKDNSTLYVASNNGSVNVVDIASGQVTETIAGTPISSQYVPAQVLISADSRWLFVLQSYVFCDDCESITPDQNGIEIINLLTRKVKYSFSISNGLAMALDPAGQNLYFSSTISQISKLNLLTGRTSAVNAITAASLSVSGDGGTLYVLQSIAFDGQSNALVAVSTENGQVLWTAPLSLTSPGQGLILNPVSPVAYVIGQFSGLNFGVAVVDLVHGVQTATTPLAAKAGSLAISSDGSTLYAGTITEDQIAVSDVASQKLIGAIETPGLPQALVVSPDGNRVYVLYGEDLSLSILVADAKTFARLQMAPLTAYTNPHLAISPDGRTVYVEPGTDSSISIEAMSAGTLAPQFSVAVSAPGILAPSADGKYLYAAANSGIIKIDLAAHIVVAQTAVSNPGLLTSLVVSVDGTKLYAGFLPENSSSQPGITVVNTSDFSVLSPIPYCGSSLALSHTGTYLFALSCSGVETSPVLNQIETATGMLANRFSFATDGPESVTALPASTELLLPFFDTTGGTSGISIFSTATGTSEGFIPTWSPQPVNVRAGNRR